MDIGSIAAVVQFVDLGCRTLFGVYRLIKDLKDVPADLLLTLQDLDYYSELMVELGAALGTDDPSLRSLTPTQLDRVARILNNTGQICQQLEHLLAPCRPSVTASRARKAWRAVVSVKREHEISKKCERLERLKQDLSRELQNCGLALLSSVKSDLSTVSITLQQTTTSITALERRLDLVHSSLGDIKSDLAKSHSRVQELPNEVDDVSLNPPEISMDKMNFSEHPGLTVNQMVAELHRYLVLEKPVGSRQSEAFSKASPTENDLLAQTASQLLSNNRGMGNAIQETRDGDINWGLASFRPGAKRHLSCGCPGMGSRPKQWARTFGLFRYSASATWRHLPQCPLFSEADNTETRSYAFTILPFLARTVELLSTTQASQRLTTFSLKVYPTVRKWHSPAYQILRACEDEVRERSRAAYGLYDSVQNLYPPTSSGGQQLVSPSRFEGLDQYLEQNFTALCSLLESGKALPAEKDELGGTLLFGLLHICQRSTALLTSSTSLPRLVCNIASRLIELGVDVEASSTEFYAHFVTSSTTHLRLPCNAADLAFDTLVRQSEPCTALGEEFWFYKQLISRLGLVLDARKIRRVARCPVGFLQYKSACLDFLRSSYIYDFSTDLTPLHFIVLGRTYEDLERVVLEKDDPILPRSALHQKQTDTTVLTAMECALGWPKGLCLLANAGYSPASAFQLAIFRQDVDSVAQILGADCPTFFDSGDAPRRRYHDAYIKSNMLKATLCLHCRFARYRGSCFSLKRSWCCLQTYELSDAEAQLKSRIRGLLVAAVKQRRAALTQLAMCHLSPPKLANLGVSLAAPLDSNASAVYAALLESGIAVPRSLYPGRKPLLLSFNIMCRLGGVSLAQALFEHGVCDIDTVFEDVTPLTSLFDQDSSDGLKENAIRWLLDNGASTTFSSDSMLPTFLFYLAAVYEPSALYSGAINLPLTLPWSHRYDRCYTGPRSLLEPVQTHTAVLLEPKTTPTMIRLVARHCDPMTRDSCCCPCSDGGCLPLHKFRNSVTATPTVSHSKTTTLSDLDRIPKRWYIISETVTSWIRDCQLEEEDAKMYLRDACRLEVFTRLGMAHTCCIFDVEHVFDFPSRRERDATMCLELQEEDVELKTQLDLIMEAYDKTTELRQGNLFDVWTWWWATLEVLLPEIPASQRTITYADYEKHTMDWVYNCREDIDRRWHHQCVEDGTDVDGWSATGNLPDHGMEFIDEIRHYFAGILAELQG